jgi:hypothetical protein
MHKYLWVLTWAYNEEKVVFLSDKEPTDRYDDNTEYAIQYVTEHKPGLISDYDLRYEITSMWAVAIPVADLPMRV